MFNENGGAMAYNCVTGNPLALIHTIWKNGKLDFDGATSYGIDENFLDVGNSFTFGCIVIPTTSPMPDDYAICLSNGHQGSARQYKCIIQQDNTNPNFRANIGDGSNAYLATDPDTYLANKSYFLVATYDGHILKLYVNGQLKATNNVSVTTYKTNKFYVGAGFTDDGILKDFSSIQMGIAFAARSCINDDQILQLYHEPYCFIEWPSRRIFFDLGAGGGPVSLSSSISATSTISASLIRSLNLSGQISASTAISGLLSLTKSLISNILSQSSITANLSISGKVYLQAVIDALSSGHADINILRELSSSIQASSSATSTISLIKGLQASLPALTALQSDLKLIKSLGGNVVANTDVQALLTRITSLISQIQALSSVQASLSGGQVEQIILEAVELLLLLEDNEFTLTLDDREFLLTFEDKEVTL